MSDRRDKIKPDVKGGLLLTRGDVIQVMDDGILTRCRVISCISAGRDGCMAALEILEGPRTGQRIQTRLSIGSRSVPGETF